VALDKAIIKAQHALKSTFDYKARDLNAKVSQSAQNYADRDAARSPDFKISQLIAEQTGISQLENAAVQDAINERVLEQLRLVEEKAYREGFELGQAEGGEKAFVAAQGALNERLESLNTVISRVESIRQRRLIDNEAEFVRLTFLIASKIAARDIAANPEAVLPVLEHIVNEMQEIEKITVNISPGDAETIAALVERGDPRTLILERTKMVTDETIQPGGCLVKTNFGDVDATVEERVERAWASLAARVPKNVDAAE
jgi:flagellar assembly protein FliH